MQSSNNTRQYASWWLDILFIAIAFSCIYFAFAGVRPLFVPDEGRYAEIAREMAVTGDFITPHLNNIVYFEKPALHYWLTALTINFFGSSLWSVRSVNIIISLLGCLATYFTARKLFDRSTGLLSAAILSTSLLYFVMANMVSLDLPVTVFLACSLYAFLLGTQEVGTNRRNYIWLSAVCAAFAVLTKGLIGIVFPAMIIGTWLLFTRQWKLLRQLYLPSSVILFLLIAAPWHILVALRNPDFLHFYFVEQQFLRYTAEGIGHYQPVWYFIPTLLLGFFPWMVFLPQACLFIPIALRSAPSGARLEGRWDAIRLFFALWVILVFLFFSFSKSKLIPYILPVFPPLAILTGNYFANALTAKPAKSIVISLVSLFAISLLLFVIFYAYTEHTDLPDAALAWDYLCLYATTLAVGSLIALVCVSIQHNLRNALIVLIMAAVCTQLFFLAAVPAIDARSIRPLATQLQSRLQPDDEVITYNQYYQDLPYYLGRRVSIVNWRNELTHGMLYHDTHDWMIDDQQFLDRWRSPRRVFVILHKDEYQHLAKHSAFKHIYLIDSTIHHVLISNNPDRPALDLLTH